MCTALPSSTPSRYHRILNISAALFGYAEIALLLLEQGADPNVVDRRMDAPHSRPPSLKAIWKPLGFCSILDVKHGANPNHATPIDGLTGDTQLITAAHDQNCAAVRLLLGESPLSPVMHAAYAVRRAC